MYIELFDEMRGCGLSTVLLFIMVAALGALMVWHSRTARKKKALLAVLAALTVLCPDARQYADPARAAGLGLYVPAAGRAGDVRGAGGPAQARLKLVLDICRKSAMIETVTGICRK